MTNLGAHHLDIVDWVLGLGDLQTVASVGGRLALEDNGETPDTQDSIFQFPNWCATMAIRECSVGERPSHGLEFYGTHGSLGCSRSGFRILADPEIAPANQIPGIQEGHPVGGPKSVPGVRGRLRGQPVQDMSGNSDEQYLEHARNFLSCIRERSKPVSDLASAHRTSIVCHLSNLSLRLGRQIRWDAARQDVINDKEASAALVRAYRAPWDSELKALRVG